MTKGSFEFGWGETRQYLPRESDEVYGVVTRLRARGYTVYRNGSNHRVIGGEDDLILSHHRFLEFERKLRQSEKISGVVKITQVKTETRAPVSAKQMTLPIDG